MKIHLAKVRPNAWGGTNTHTLCNRSNAKSADGFNSTDEVAQVTCKFCLALLKSSAVQHSGDGA